MNRRNLLASASALALAIVSPTLAAPNPGAGKARGKGGAKVAAALKRLEANVAKLNLDARQKPQAHAALDAARAELTKLQNAPGTPQEKRPKFQALRKDLRGKLQKILTPAQNKQLRQLQAAERGGKPGSKAAKAAPPKVTIAPKPAPKK